jgi:hypothetical protein
MKTNLLAWWPKSVRLMTRILVLAGLLWTSQQVSAALGTHVARSQANQKVQQSAVMPDINLGLMVNAMR